MAEEAKVYQVRLQGNPQTRDIIKGGRLSGVPVTLNLVAGKALNEWPIELFLGLLTALLQREHPTITYEQTIDLFDADRIDVVQDFTDPKEPLASAPS